MNIYPLASVLATACCLSVALFVYLKDTQHLLNRSFALITTLAGVWTLFPFAISLPRDGATALALGRAIYFFAAFVPCAFCYFVAVLLRIDRDKLERRILAALLLVSVLFAAVAFNDHFLSGVIRRESLFAVSPGTLYIPFMIFFGVGCGYAFYKSFMGYLASSGARRNQLKYVLTSFAFAYTAGLMHFAGAYVQAEPFPHDLLLIVFAGLISYAIVRHRLMDVTVVLNKGLAYGVVLGILLIPVSIAVLVGQRATFYSIPPLLVGCLVLGCGLWAVTKPSRTVSNLTFGSICLSLCAWLFGIFMMYSAPSAAETEFWSKVIYAGLVYLPAFFYHFTVSLLQRRSRDLVLIHYLVGTTFLLLLPTPLLVDGYHSYYWGYYPRAGLLHPVFLGYFVTTSILSLRLLYVGHKTAQSLLEVTRIRYVFWAFIIAHLAALDFLQTYGVAIYPAGYVFVGVWALTVSYAIAKYQLLDLSFFFTKSNLWPFAQALSIGTAAYLIILLLVWFFTGALHYQLAGILLATNMVFAGLLATLQQHVEGMVGKALFKERHRAYETLREFGKAMVTILDLPTLSQTILATLQRALSVRNVSLFLFDAEKNVYTLMLSTGLGSDLKAFHLPAQEGLADYLRYSRSILVREELEHEGTAAVEAVVQTMHAMGSEVSLPLINKDRLIGFINLGTRRGARLYAQDDLNLLTSLAQNASIALDNAMLYTDLKRSQLLMRRTDRLRSLETIAGGFAHEIRNPLTSIKTFIQLAPDRKHDEEFIDQFGQVVLEDVYRIERLIQEILDYARYMQPQFTEEHVNEIVTSSLLFMEVKAAHKRITIEKELGQNLPSVTLDRQQIKQVLLNLFLNAMDAMAEQGGVLTVRTHRLTKESSEAWVQIEVSDTGSGIPSANLEHIFDPFYTTKHESEEREGTGLGLTIVHQIVQEHSGYIEVGSVVGGGTTFYINLPSRPLSRATFPKEDEDHEKASPLGR